MEDERKRILRMVEKGQLTVAEALILLENLDSDGKKRRAADVDMETPNEVSTYRRPEENKSWEESFDGDWARSTRDKFFDFVDTTFQKVKNFDLDFNFGKHETVNHIFQHTNPDIEEIDIDIANGSLEIIPWDQADVRIECAAKVYRVDSPDEARQQFLKETTFDIDDSKLRFILQQKFMKMKTVCYVPEKEYEKVRLRLFNGPITVENLAAKTLKGKTANGKLQLTGVRGADMELETANGSIVLTGAVGGKVEAETINGKVYVHGDFEEIDVQTFNGNIDCFLENNRCTFLQMKAVTGAIEVIIAQPLNIKGELKTNLGSFHLQLAGADVIKETTEMTQKTLHFQTSGSGERELHLLADTKTGSMTFKNAESK